MSAYLDQDQVVKFYFGNAMNDLEAFLPQEDPAVVLEARRLVNSHGDFEPALRPHSAFEPLNSLEITLKEVENTMKDLMATRKELSFLMSDLSRLLGKK